VPESAVLPEPWSDLGIPEDEGKRCPKNWRSPKRAIVKLADFRHAKFLSLDSQYSFGYEQWLRGLCERLGGFEPDIAAVGNSADSLQVLRDVAQNVAFAGSILDVYRAKEQVILALLERDVVVDIPQRAMAVLALPYLSFTCTTASGTRAIHGSLKGGWRKSWTTCLLKERSFR
jgi:hypothetical protein